MISSNHHQALKKCAKAQMPIKLSVKITLSMIKKKLIARRAITADKALNTWIFDFTFIISIIPYWYDSSRRALTKVTGGGGTIEVN